jgi:hypothetical protein
MVQTFFERSCTIDRLRRGPLAGHIDLFAARLATDGYSRVHRWCRSTVALWSSDPATAPTQRRRKESRPSCR